MTDDRAREFSGAVKPDSKTDAGGVSLLAELYEFCRGLNDFRLDSNLARRIQAALRSTPVRCDGEPVARVGDPLDVLVERFSRRLLAKLRLAQANGKSGWERDDWEAACQQGLMRHLEKGDPRDVAAYCAFMDHHGWITKAAAPPARSDAGSAEAAKYICRLFLCAQDECDQNGCMPGTKAYDHLAAILVLSQLPATDEAGTEPRPAFCATADSICHHPACTCVDLSPTPAVKP